MAYMSGADVELVGLLKSATRWLAGISSSGQYPHRGVHSRNIGFISFGEWDAKIKAAFERHFWVPEHSHDDHMHVVDSRLVHRRGIYKVCCSFEKSKSSETISIALANSVNTIGRGWIKCGVHRLPASSELLHCHGSCARSVP